VDGRVCATFQEACVRMGLLQSDSLCRECLDEAVTFAMPAQLRGVFSNLLTYGHCANPQQVWLDYRAHLAEDFLRSARDALPAHRRDQPLSPHDTQQAEYEALRHLDVLLQQQQKSLAEYQLPQPPPREAGPDPVVPETSAYDVPLLRARVERDAARLNPEQRAVCDTIKAAISNPDLRPSNAFFIDSPGGCGKTFLLSHLLDSVRAQRRVAYAVASCGIAALLLPDGTTAHSRFKIPNDLGEASVCKISTNSPTAKLLKEASLIVWDEAPMCHKLCFDAVDRLLRDITGKRDRPFGGKVVVLAGDFRQLLPVVPRGSRAAIVAASLKRHQLLWPHIRCLQLRTNMRAMVLLETLGEEAAGRQRDWASYLLAVGEGREGLAGQDLRLPDDLVVPGEDVQDLVRDVYGDLSNDPTARLPETLINRCILTPKNVDMQRLNDFIMQLMPGQEHVSLSADQVEDEEQEAAFPPEFLNSLNPSDLPPHKLSLKPGCPIILLRNINFQAGLANGTRLIVNEMRRNTLLATILSGSHSGEQVIIPRIKLTAKETPKDPVAFGRTQFPVRLAFAMSINKAQGQTLKRVGIYLPQPCFSHGQLYVAMSRVGERSGVRVMVVRGGAQGARGGEVFTKNVVYAEIFDAAPHLTAPAQPQPQPPPLFSNTLLRSPLIPRAPSPRPIPLTPLPVQPPPLTRAVPADDAIRHVRDAVRFSPILVPLFAIALGQQNNPIFNNLAATYFPPGSVLAQALPRITLILSQTHSWEAVASPHTPNYIEVDRQEQILDHIFHVDGDLGMLISNYALQFFAGV
jgi:ATP-dependent DNA helicase PIF1